MKSEICECGHVKRIHLTNGRCLHEERNQRMEKIKCPCKKFKPHNHSPTSAAHMDKEPEETKPVKGKFTITSGSENCNNCNNPENETLSDKIFDSKLVLGDDISKIFAKDVKEFIRIHSLDLDILRQMIDKDTDPFDIIEWINDLIVKFKKRAGKKLITNNK